jgi:O-antigen ligase
VPLAWLAAATTAALAIGAVAVIDVRAAVVLVTGFSLVPLLVLRPPILLATLVGTVFLSVLTVGGVTIGRLLAPLALFVVFVALMRGVGTIVPSAPLGWTLAYSLWAFASGLWTVSLGGTIFQLGSLAIALVYMLAFATLLRTERVLLVGLYAAAAVALGVALTGIMSAQGRAEGVSGDPNEFARILLVMLPLVIVLAAQVGARWLRIVLYAVVALIVLAVFASLSRGGMLTLIATVLLVLTVPARTLFRSGPQKAAVIVLLVVGGVAAFQVSGAAASERINAIFANEDETGAGRLNAWKAAWTAVEERPILGLGYGGFDPSANELMLRTPGVDLSNQKLLAGGLKAHSTYIGTLAELGVLGLILFLGVLVSTIRALREIAARARRLQRPFVMRLANALVISLVGWAVASLFLSSETSRTLWIIVGLSVGLGRVLDGNGVGVQGSSEQSPGVDRLGSGSARR